VDLPELYRLHSDAVFRTALRVTGNPADAEDVLQTVFLRVAGQAGKIDPLGQPLHYLRRAATNAAIDLLRKKNVLPETGLLERHAARSTESTLVLKDRLRRALAVLPPRDAELFVLCYLEGYTYDDLAEQFEMERSTVGTRLHRIRAVLQAELGK
jgi:RNA polymerase sigma-70 factor (ECF subfamily)